MSIQAVLHLLGTLGLLGYGIGSLLLPHPMAKFIAQVLNTPRGIAEFRVVNGGYFIGLAGFALGVGWLGAAGARVFAYLVDQPPLEPIYGGLLIFEVAMGLMLIV